MTMGWLEINFILATKKIHKKINGVTVVGYSCSRTHSYVIRSYPECPVCL
jgi:hypothetical protein